MAIPIFRDWPTFDELGKGPQHLALGVFDGVHVGHQAVIQAALSEKARVGGSVGVVTFDPHPIRVLFPEKAPAALLATLEHKAHLLERLGVDWILAVNFTPEFAQRPAEWFLENLAQFSPQTLAVGEDWRFGRNRAGDANLLREWCAAHGATLHALPPVLHDGERVSSTRIRQAIRDGNFPAVTQMLGSDFTLEAVVVRGQGLARQFGFPTANLDFGCVQLPSDGVWAVKVKISPEPAWRDAVANLGFRPTVGGHVRVLEVHILQFSGDLYDETLEVRFEKKLREEQKFPSINELKAQISRDVVAAQAHFDA